MTLGFTHESTANETKEWYTPKYIFDKLNIEFDLDPCSPENLIIPWIPVKKRYSIVEDGLKQEWIGKIWMNPPYGTDTPVWLEKFSNHGNGIALVFSRTDTSWFHKYAVKADIICFIKGRISFVKSDLTKGGTPGVGSMLLSYGEICNDAIIKSNLGQCYKKY